MDVNMTEYCQTLTVYPAPPALDWMAGDTGIAVFALIGITTTLTLVLLIAKFVFETMCGRLRGAEINCNLPALPDNLSMQGNTSSMGVNEVLETWV